MRNLAAVILGLFLSLLVSRADDKVELITDNDVFYASLMEDIQNAKESIHMEYFMFQNNSFGYSFLEAMARKAEEGVDVYLICDFASKVYNFYDTFSFSSFREYKKRGVHMAVYNKFPFLPRNHSKLTVIDGRTAYVSSHNIKNSGSISFSDIEDVRELAVKIEGVSVGKLVGEFVDVWNKCVPSKDELPHPVAADDSGDIDVVSSMGFIGLLPDRFYIPLIRSSEDRIRLITGYFMPTRNYVKAIREAAERGVKVDLLIGGDTDLPFFLKGIPYRKVARLGKQKNIDVHVLKDVHIHSKAASFDDSVVMIGSTNLDLLSLRCNRELDVIFHMDEVVEDFISYFDSMKVD